MGHMITNYRGSPLSIPDPAGFDYRTVLFLGHGHTSEVGDISVEIVLGSVSQEASQLTEMASTRCAIKCVVKIMIQFDERGQFAKMVVHLLDIQFQLS